MWQVLSDVRESKRQQSSSSACGDEKEKKEEKSCEFCALQRNSLQVPSHPIYGFCYLLSSAPLMLVGPTTAPSRAARREKLCSGTAANTQTISTWKSEFSPYFLFPDCTGSLMKSLFSPMIWFHQ